MLDFSSFIFICGAYLLSFGFQAHFLFEVYNLPKPFCYFVGFLKVGLSLILLASIYLESLTLIGSLGLAVLLLGSIVMHIKVKDELLKSFPALLFFILNIAIAYISNS